ncbi:hypothetical protein OC507_01620 [Vibrio vulnificus]|nr:hypothetical protein [Vibrio vulnificus]
MNDFHAVPSGNQSYQQAPYISDINQTEDSDEATDLGCDIFWAVHAKDDDSCYTIVYYDQSKRSRELFYKRHAENLRLVILLASSIEDLLQYVDFHKSGVIKIDMLLSDFFSERRALTEVYIEYYTPQFSSKKNEHVGTGDTEDTKDTEDTEDTKDAKTDKMIRKAISDFQSHKDHLIIQMAKKYNQEGLNATYTMLDYFELHDIDDIQLGIFSMLGRRLVSSTDSSRLQSKGVVWIWKSKEALIKSVLQNGQKNENESDKESDDILKADANSEFDSIHTALTAKALRDKKINALLGKFKESLHIQVLQFAFIVFGCLVLGYNIYNDFLLNLDELSFNSLIEQITPSAMANFSAFIVGVLIMYLSIKSAYKICKEINQVLR